MLSKNSVKLLKWMNENDDWMYYREIEKSCPAFEYRSIRALRVGGYIDSPPDGSDASGCTEYDDPIMVSQYRISSNGKAYLEFQASNRWKEFRSWVSLAIAVAAFVKSFFF